MDLVELKKSLPANLQSAANAELLDRINSSITDPEGWEIYKEGLLDYQGVLQSGKYKISSYVDAVRYVTFKLLGATNQDAYAKTFPDKFNDFVARGMSSKTISAYVSAYHNGKLVSQIIEQSLVPFWLVNQKARQDALNKQIELMYSAESEFVQCQAAESVLKHTEKPKEAGPLINFDMRENSGMEELKGLLQDLASKQLDSLQNGMVDVKTIAEQEIKDAD